MNMIERWFGGPKDVSKELEEKPVEVVKEEKAPKAIGDIKQAKGDIANLQEKRQGILNHHRDTTEELRALGANEYKPDSAPRTETVKDILNPIEEELVAISKGITDKRTEFDLQPSHVEVLDARLQRLEDLKAREEADFLNTPIGKDIHDWENKIEELEKNATDLRKSYAKEEEYMPLLKESGKLREKKSYAFINDKIAAVHADRINRISRLMADVGANRHDAKSTGYDDKGHMRV